MSGFIDVPNFWDYLGEGINAGHATFLRERDRREDLRQRKLQEDMQAFQTAMQYGDIGSAQRLASMIPTLQGVQLQETPDQTRRRLTSQKPIELPTIPGLINKTKIEHGTDTEREYAGMKTSLDRQKEDLDRRNIQYADTNFMRDKQLERWQKIAPALSTFAQNYVQTLIANTGGRIDPKKMGVMADDAFRLWQKEAQNTAFGNMTPEDAMQAKQFFGAAMQAMYQQQIENDIRRVAAMPSTAYRDNTPQLINALNGLAKTKWDEAEPLNKQLLELQTSPLYAAARGMSADDLKKNPMLSGIMGQVMETQKKINGLKQSAQALQNSAAALAAGRLAPEAAGQLLQQYVGPAMPEQVTGQPQQAAPGMPYQPMPGQPETAPAAASGLIQQPTVETARPPLSAESKMQAKRNPMFKRWLRDKGYTDAEME